MTDFQNLKELLDYLNDLLFEVGFVSVAFEDSANYNNLKAKDFPRAAFYDTGKSDLEHVIQQSIYLVAVSVGQKQNDNNENEKSISSYLNLLTSKVVNRLRLDGHINDNETVTWERVENQLYDGLSGYSCTLQFTMLRPPC